MQFEDFMQAFLNMTFLPQIRVYEDTDVNLFHLLNEELISIDIIQQHIEGDLVKFYGVEGTPFFHCHSQSATHYDFNPDTLRLIAGRASATLRLPIYGGDAIVTPEGAIFVIDFNDWPSFSTCRPQAATAIAQRLLSSVNPCH